MELATLRGRQRRVLEAIIGAPLGWQSRASISRRARVRSGPVLEALHKLEWVARWEKARDGKALRRDYWTLTPLGAEWAGVLLDEEDEGSPRWFTTPVERPHHSHERLLRYPERIPDPRPPTEFLEDPDEGTWTKDPTEARKLWGIPIARMRQKSGRTPMKPKSKRVKM